MPRMKLLALLTVIVFAAGCAADKLRTPALRDKSFVPTTPVILIPGTTRTKLVDSRTGATVWGNLFNYLGPHTEDILSLPIDSTDLDKNISPVVPGDLLDEIAIIPKLLELQLYTKFLRVMKQNQYRRGDIDHPKPGDNFFIFLYDWRLPHDTNARILAQKVAKLKETLGPQGQKFDLIAHSSAVFIARYYLLYGGKDVRPQPDPVPDYAGASDIRKLILVNPSHQGLLYAFQILHEGFKPVHFRGARRFTPYEIFTDPAFFALMPRYDENPFVNSQGDPVNISLYDADNWVKYGWSVFSKSEQARLEAQMKQRFPMTWETEMKKENDKRFEYLKAALAHAVWLQKAVSEKLHPLPKGIDAHVFVTEWGPTPERVCLEGPEGVITFKDGNCQAELMADGDNLVTSTSLRGHYGENPPQYIFLKEKHSKIANNKQVHAHILHILRNEE